MSTTASSSSAVIETVQNALSVLSSEDDLSPRNELINKTLSQLVRRLSKDHPLDVVDVVLRDPIVRKTAPALLEKLSEAESAMEVFWAERLCQKDVIAQDDLQSFWYWTSYVDLVSRELPHLAPRAKPEAQPSTGGGTDYRADSICFVGSGPLPLTAIVLHQLSSGRPVTCVDICPAACALSRTLISKAGLKPSAVEVVCADGAAYDYGRHGSVLVAALVPDKAAVLRRIGATAQTGNVVVGIRSAERLHTLLYAPLDETMVELPVEGPVARTRWAEGVINTTVFYEGSEKWRDDMASLAKGRDGGTGARSWAWGKVCMVM